MRNLGIATNPKIVLPIVLAALVAEWFELWLFEWMVVGSNPISGLSFDFQKLSLLRVRGFRNSHP